MPYKIKTDELPVETFPPRLYPAVVKCAVLRTTKSSGEPMIEVTLQAPPPLDKDRVDRIVLKSAWFEPDFSPKALKRDGDQAGFDHFVMVNGSRSRPGRLQQYLGRDCDLILESAQQIAQLLDSCTGMRVWVLETPRKDGKGGSDLRVTQERPDDKRLPEGTRELQWPNDI